jgi:hypothetical protein
LTVLGAGWLALAAGRAGAPVGESAGLHLLAIARSGA